MLPNGEMPAQMCILRALVAATEGNPPEADETSLKFVGTSAVRIKTLKSVEEIMNEIAYPKNKHLLKYFLDKFPLKKWIKILWQYFW